MVLTGNSFFFGWGVSLMVWLQAHLGAFGAVLASFLSAFGEELACVAVLGFVYWCWDKEFGRFIGLNVLMVNVLNPMIKNIFIRRRPYFDHPEIACLRPVEKGADLYDIGAQGYSFPSGHSSNAAAVYGSLFAYRRKSKALLVLGILLPLLVGVSRFCVGVHYPTDVLCGWLLGLAVLLAVPCLSQRIRDRRIFFGLLLLISLPGFFYCKSADYFSGVGMLLGFMAAIVFEEQKVKFRNTRSPLRCVLRLLGGIAVFFAVNTLLKLPFSKEFLGSGTMGAYLVRCARYAIVTFADMALYPMLFAPMDRVLEKKSACEN